MPIEAQIDALRGPQDMGEAGIVTISEEALVWASSALRLAIDATGARVPYLYPTPDGDVVAEWTFGSLESSVTFIFGSMSLRLFSTNVDTGQFFERTVATAPPASG